MTPAPLALASVRHTLKEIAHAGDGERLRHLLRGRELPTLGSGEEPAMQIIQALEFPPYDAGITHGIGRLTGCQLGQAMVEADQGARWAGNQLVDRRPCHPRATARDGLQAG